jgi:DNA-binding response OmpR family regulator
LRFAAQQVSMERPKLKGRTVLVVEDEPLIAIDISEAFKKAGALVTMTTSLNQAMTLVENDGLSVAILDHALNDGDSSVLYSRLKERNIPFVIYSGFAKVGDIVVGAPVVPKPARAEVLIQTVEGLLPPEPDKT